MIIGFSGKMQTGKTTCANHLASLTGGVVMSFADQLRNEVAELFDIPVALQRDPVMKEHMEVSFGRRRMSLRHLLQFWGALRREQNPDYWVDRLLQGLVMECPVIIDDVRYLNEAVAIKEEGGILVRLQPHAAWQPGTGSDHISETDLDDYEGFDLVLTPPLGELETAARRVFNLI